LVPPYESVCVHVCAALPPDVSDSVIDGGTPLVPAMFHVTTQYSRCPATGAGDQVTVSVGDVNADELTY
jgi:hypothetical protein